MYSAIDAKEERLEMKILFVFGKQQGEPRDENSFYKVSGFCETSTFMK